MDRTRVLSEVRVMRFEEVMGRYGDGRLSCEEAADVLGMSVSSFYRWRRRFESAGIEGLADGRIGKASGRRAPTGEVARMLALYETRYFDFTAKHFHEKAVAEHDLKRSCTWTKNRLQDAGKVGKAKRHGAHRRKRPRKPLVGMMLHQDGSRHEWVSGQEWDPIVTSCRRHARGMMDDADSTIHSAFFVAEEGTMSSFQGVLGAIERQGLFGSPYADRGTHYWITTEACGKVNKTNPTQVHRGASSLASN